MGGGDIKVRRTETRQLTNRWRRGIYYGDSLGGPHGLHSNGDDCGKSGACVLGPFRRRGRTTVDARDSAHRVGHPGSVPPRHVVAGFPQGREPGDAVDVRVSTFEPPSKLGLHVESKAMKGDL